MNREIKFRAWDDYKEVIHPNVAVINGMCYLIDSKDNAAHLTTSAGYEWVKPMQYTGLKDKNNVEIYEGDIVEAPSEILEVRYNSFKAQFEAFYEGLDGRTGIKHTHFIYGAGLTECKVIGNIYENKGLLA